MNLTKITLLTLFSIALTRFIPHPPNFTSLIAISFYIPLIFGTIYMPIVLFSFVITDIFIGFHNVLFFTWGSVVIIGLLSKYFASLGFKFRILGALSANTCVTVRCEHAFKLYAHAPQCTERTAVSRFF